ncbi:protein-tyrosine phosphatase family protein [Parashewanella tropica]|uniref:protein-tyrosine phosphatase family protein n=1 Tax=Parashewanella tropica TaxID=2547970 RepID=UPI001478C6A5|nr:protein-tyrosine phosphatase family protein [Parashewanella tropica]
MPTSNAVRNRRENDLFSVPLKEPLFFTGYNYSFHKSQSEPALKKFHETQLREQDSEFLQRVEKLNALRRTSVSREYYSIPKGMLMWRNHSGYFTTSAELSICSPRHYTLTDHEPHFDSLSKKTLKKWPINNMLCQPEYGYFSDTLISDTSLVPISIPVSGTHSVEKVKGLIAANYISIHTIPKTKFISTNTPICDDTDDKQVELFWLMAFQQDIGLIVDLSYSSLANKDYCPTYVASRQFGSITVVKTGGNKFLSNYLLFDMKTGKSKQVNRLDVDDWHSSVLYDLISLDALVCEIYQMVSPKQGAIIHCNSGTGKSGVVLNALNLFCYRSQPIPHDTSLNTIVDESIVSLRIQKSPNLVGTPLMLKQIMQLLSQWQNMGVTDV